MFHDHLKRVSPHTRTNSNYLQIHECDCLSAMLYSNNEQLYKRALYEML